MNIPDVTPPAAPAPPPVSRLPFPLLATLVLAAAAFALAAWTWSRLPAGAHIPIHWNLAGQVDGYGSRAMLFLQPLVILGLGVLLHFLPLIEPRRGRELRSNPAYTASWLGLVLFMAAIHVTIVRAAFGGSFFSPQGLWFCLGALLVVIGNFLGKIRSNWFVGIRTPWTLSSDLSWNKTHRLGGRLFVLGGLLLMIAAAAGLPPRLFAPLLVAWIVLTLAILLVYSYRIWRADPQRDHGRRSPL